MERSRTNQKSPLVYRFPVGPYLNPRLPPSFSSRPILLVSLVQALALRLVPFVLDREAMSGEETTPAVVEEQVQDPAPVESAVEDVAAKAEVKPKKAKETKVKKPSAPRKPRSPPAHPPYIEVRSGPF